MAHKVVFSPQAIEDLELIVRYVARHNPAAALRVGNALIRRVAILEQHPFIGAPYRKHPGTRKLSCPPYLIFYRVKDRQRCVEILRYWHGARAEPPFST
jgi:addiction module RelE/StbE family toxin